MSVLDELFVKVLGHNVQ